MHSVCFTPCQVTCGSSISTLEIRQNRTSAFHLRVDGVDLCIKRFLQNTFIFLGGGGGLGQGIRVSWPGWISFNNIYITQSSFSQESALQRPNIQDFCKNCMKSSLGQQFGYFFSRTCSHSQKRSARTFKGRDSIF